MINPKDMADFPCFNRVSLATVVFSLLSWSEACYSILLSLNESCFCLGAGAGMLTQAVPCDAVCSFLGLYVIRCCTAQTKILFCFKSRSVWISTPLSDTSSLSYFWEKSLSACYFSFHKNSIYLQWRMKQFIGHLRTVYCPIFVQNGASSICKTFPGINKQKSGNT